MRIQLIFFYAVLILAVFAGQGYAGSKRWRKFEKKFKNAFGKARDALPVVQQYAGLIGGLKALGK